jgi:hypothetical protein
VLDVAHALIVADHQGQEGNDHHPSVGEVAIEKVERIGNAHLFAGFVDQIDQRIDTAGEIVGGTHLDVGPGGRLGSEVRSGLQIVVAGLGLHLVSHQNMLAATDQLVFLEAEVGVTIRLVHACLRVE